MRQYKMVYQNRSRKNKDNDATTLLIYMYYDLKKLKQKNIKTEERKKCIK